MLKQPCGLLFHKLADHVAKYGSDSVEALIRGANVIQSIIVEEDFLDDEDGNGLGQLGTGFHDPQTEGNDLSRQKKVDDLGRIVLNKGANNTKAGESEVFKGA